MLNISNVRKSHSIAKGCGGNDEFNCWGATLYALGATKQLFWADDDDINDFIETKTTEVSGKLKKGDILALYDRIGISHTAVYIGGGKWFHKRGGLDSRYDSKNDVLDDYYLYCTHYKIYRVKK